MQDVVRDLGGELDAEALEGQHGIDEQHHAQIGRGGNALGNLLLPARRGRDGC